MTEDSDDDLSVGEGLAELAESVLALVFMGMFTVACVAAGTLWVVVHSGTPTAETGVSLAFFPAVIVAGVGIIGLLMDAYDYTGRVWSYVTADSNPSSTDPDEAGETA